MLVILPDTNILLSARLLDLVMRSHAAGLIDVAWCDELLDEFSRKLVEKRQWSPERAEGLVRRFMAAAPDGRIDPVLYLHLIPHMHGHDADDHVLSAAARGGGVDVILTENIDDFPDQDVGPDCIAMTASQVFAHLAELYPTDLAEVVRRSSANLTRPPLSPLDILDRLAAVGLVEMADLVRPHLC